jgi:TP901 family phage tail tape measure protein
MARNERYITTVELNSQQAMDRLNELKKKVDELRKKRDEAFAKGEFFDEKQLTKATREMNRWKGQIEGIQGILENINDMSLSELQKAVRELKRQSANMLPDSSEWKENQRQVMNLENRIKELRNSFRENNEEAERLKDNAENLGRVLGNIKSASLNELLQAQKYLEENIANMKPEAAEGFTMQLKEIKARIQEIKGEQQQIVRQMDRYDQEIKAANKDMATMERESKFVEATMKNLSRANVRDLEYSIKIVNEELRNMTRGTKAFEEMQAKAKKLRTELERIRYESAAQQGLLSRTADFFNKVQGSVIVGLSSITGLTLTVRRAVQAFADMDQEMENVRKYTGQTTEQVHAMNEEFKNIDTRTSRERLNQLAGDAGRLGIQGKVAIMDFVDAADKINVALGDDLGEGAVKNIGKLAMSFGTDKTMGLRGAMLATGSAVNELSQNSSAAAEYLVDFTARVAGFGKQVGLTQTQIMGFGAVMDENMLRDEMAATAFGQLLVKMTTDLDTFARLTGMKVEEYKKLVTEDINGAILAVARSLKGRDLQDLGKVFDAMNLDGQRAISVLATLGDKVDDVSERQRIATEAFEKGTSIIEEFNIQNTTVQAGLEKAKKKFNELRIELGEQLMPVARYAITTGAMLVKSLSILMEFVSQFKATIMILIPTITLLVLKKEADVLITKAEIFWNEKLVATFKKLWALLASNPWSAAAAGAMLLVGVIIDLTRVTKEVVTFEDRLNKLREDSKKKIVDEKTELELLIKASKNDKLSLDERMKAIKKLEGIIPGYITELDKETGAYKENKEALDNYLTSLARKYELEGAKEMLQEIGKDLAELNKQYTEAYENNEKAKQLSAGTGTRSAYNPGESLFLTANAYRAESELEKANEAIQKKLEERRKIYAIYGVELQKDAAKAQEQEQTVVNNNQFTDPKAEEKQRKAAEAAAKKLEAQRKRDLKERNDALKAETEAELAVLASQYARGLIDYRSFVAKRDEIMINGFNKRMAIYEEESDEYKQLLNDREQYNLKAVERGERMNMREVELVHQSIMAELQAKQWNDEGAMLEALYQEDINYLQNKAALFRQGSEERMEIEEEIQEREYQHQLERQQRYEEMLEDLKENYLNQGNKRQMEIALNGLDELHRQGLLKEEEYQKARIAIQAQYAGNSLSPNEQTKKTGSEMLTTARSKVNDNAQNNSTDIDSPIVGTINRYKNVMEQLKVLYANDEQNHAAYLSAKAQATSEFCQQLASEFQVAYNMVNQIMSAASNYYAAQSDYEVAVMNKKYDKMADKAGNNQKKLKKIEEKRQKEEAAIKSKYNAKQVKIQIAQAIAQTAMSAINAYSSAAAVPVVGYILAPIAAAAAVAAGMIQVAAIKKQAAAQEAGYYSGGFTGGNKYRKEAGVVHEGEFVANHDAVNNPNVRPMLEFIDRAQKNSTVGGLTAEDISRQLSNGGTALVTPIVNVNNDNEELREELARDREVKERLLDVIENDGIKVDFPMDKFDNSYNHYKNLNK